MAINIVIISVTLLGITVISFALLQNFLKERKLRTELERLASELEKANGKLAEHDRLKTEFVAIASHQLRSPLTSIRGYVSLLQDGSCGQLSPQADQALERIAESAKHMAYSIEDYLNISQIETGNMQYVYSDVNLKNEVERIVDDLRFQATKKGLVILHRNKVNGHGVIHADQGKVFQISQNILNNAIKYTPQGGIKVFVRDDLVRKKIYVDVEDNGIGMNQKDIHTIFDKFARARNASTVDVDGTGLGLYVAYKMTKDMGGEIYAHSEGEGKGSRFTVEFPMVM